jgi:tuberculosinol/isotuberculosinol synthase
MLNLRRAPRVSFRVCTGVPREDDGVDLNEFRSLPLTEVSRLVRQAGPKVCVFPINGTRRWFVLEYPSVPAGDFSSAYLDAIVQRHIELYRLLFDHGLDTLLTPAFGPDLLERGEDYVLMAVEGLGLLATHPDFQTFFREYGVRVRFYGDYRKYFGPTPYAHVLDAFDAVMEDTANFGPYRLFFGLFAHDAAESVAELAVRYHAEHGRIPDKDTLVELYYGEHVDPVSLFIGFDKFCAFDMPLVATGNEDLYFTICPSPYLNEPQLRDILYDHLYARCENDPDYSAMGPDDWALMRDFYRINRERILGIGAKQPRGGFWYPLPQVELPGDFP